MWAFWTEETLQLSRSIRTPMNRIKVNNASSTKMAVSERGPATGSTDSREMSEIGRNNAITPASLPRPPRTELTMPLITAIMPAGPHDRRTTAQAKPTSLAPVLEALRSSTTSMTIDRSKTTSSKTNGKVHVTSEPSKGSTLSGAGRDPITTNPANLVATSGKTTQLTRDLLESNPLSPLASLAAPRTSTTAIAIPKSVRSVTDDEGLMWPNTTAQHTPTTANE